MRSKEANGFLSVWDEERQDRNRRMAVFLEKKEGDYGNGNT